MRGKTKAALLGVVIGIGSMAFIELMDFWLSDGGFFDTGQSWLFLALFVVMLPLLMVHAYNTRQGIYRNRDEASDDPEQDQN